MTLDALGADRGRIASDVGFPLVIGMAIILFALLMAWTGDAGHSLRMAGLVFVWIYGMNVLNIARRVPRLIRGFVAPPQAGAKAVLER